MVLLSFGIALLLAGWCWRNVRHLKERGNHGFAYQLFRNGLTCLLPFIAVVGLYYVAFAYLRHTQSVSLGTTVHIEEKLEQVKHFVGYFKVSPLVVLTVLLVLYLAVLTGMSTRSWVRWRKGIKGYTKYVGFSYMLLVLLTSFTFLGSLPGQPQLATELKIKGIRQQYGALRSEVASTLAAETSMQLVQQAYKAFPAWYPASLSLPSKIANEATDLSTHYSKAATEYGIKDPTIESAITKYSPASPPGATSEPKLHDLQPESGDIRVPQSTTEGRSRAALGSVESYRAQVEAQLSSDAMQAGAKEVVVQFADGLIEHATSFLTAVGDSHPLLRPVIDTVLKTMNDSFEKVLGEHIDRATQAAANGRPQAIAEQANDLVVNTQVVASPEALSQAQAGNASEEAALADVSAQQGQLDRAISRVIDSWISQLASPDGAIRDQAVSGLEKSGADLSQSQVDQLVHLMREGQGSWETFLYRDPGEHCSWWQRTTIKGYAGEALANIESSHVDAQLAAEARTAAQEGVGPKYRVTDPGWI